MTVDRALLISLPHGFGVSGVAMWAARLAGALADRSWRVGIALHAVPPGTRTLDLAPPDVRIFDMTGLPSFGELGEDITPIAPHYRDALDELGWSRETPCILLPNLEAGSYALAAAFATTDADRLRVIGWQHSDTRFDRLVMRTYEPMLHRIVGVSGHIAGELARDLPWRRDDIAHLPYGVEVRTDLGPPRDGRALRIVYTGRMEHEQKRIGVLCELARELNERGIPHELELIGDGPAGAEVDDRLRGLPSARRIDPLPQNALRARLDDADLFVLASRYEGLAVSMLEAMARGVAPIVTRIDSGAAEAIEHGRTGLLMDAGLDEDEPKIAHRFADAIERLARDRDMLEELRRGALAQAGAFGLDRHATRAAALFEQVLSEPPRPWPLQRACAFTGASTTSSDPSGQDAHGSVPPDSAARTRAALSRIRIIGGERIAIYGAGRFTRAVAEALADAPIDCIADDNPALWGTRLWGWPIVDPRSLPDRGVTDVLVASWLHADVMSDRITEALGESIRVHRVYDHSAASAPVLAPR